MDAVVAVVRIWYPPSFRKDIPHEPRTATEVRKMIGELLRWFFGEDDVDRELRMREEERKERNERQEEESARLYWHKDYTPSWKEICEDD